MKQKRDISWFSICRGLFFLPVFIPLLLSAQEANTHIIRDSVPAKSEGTLQISPSDLFPPKTIHSLYIIPTCIRKITIRLFPLHLNSRDTYLIIR